MGFKCQLALNAHGVGQGQSHLWPNLYQWVVIRKKGGIKVICMHPELLEGRMSQIITQELFPQHRLWLLEALAGHHHMRAGKCLPPSGNSQLAYLQQRGCWLEPPVLSLFCLLQAQRWMCCCPLAEQKSQSCPSQNFSGEGKEVLHLPPQF